jgi:carbonic anhydrase
VAKAPEAAASEPKSADSPKSQAERRLEDATRKPEAKPGSGLPPWSYEGDLGPDYWGERYAMCARGRNQSPINIAGPVLRVKYELIHDYRSGQLAMVVRCTLMCSRAAACELTACPTSC